MNPFDANTFECCDQPAVVRRPLSPGRVRWEGVQLCCTRCGAERPVVTVHFAWRMRHTACCLEIDGEKRATTLLPGSITCDDCILMLVTELSEAPVPDWRPDRSIAEDFYAA